MERTPLAVWVPDEMSYPERDKLLAFVPGGEVFLFPRTFVHVYLLSDEMNFLV
jgi:hypothetical protein